MTKEVSVDKHFNGSGKESFNNFTGAGFGKAERLCSEKLIASLFEAGHSFFVPPLKIIYLKTKLPSQSPVQLLISVPKRNFPKAHERNRIKRLIREAFRKQKHLLYTPLATANMQIAMAILYTSKKITTFNEAENKIKLALSRLSQDAGNQ